MYSRERWQDEGACDIEDLSSDDLKAILVEDINSSESDRLSPEEIKYIVGILRGREEDEICTDTNEKSALKSFQNHHSHSVQEKSKTGNEPEMIAHRKNKGTKRRKRFLLKIVAVIGCLLIAGTITASAFQIDIVSAFKSWTEELFQVKYSGVYLPSVSTQSILENEESLKMCNSASEVLSILEVTQSLLPTWIPSDFLPSEFKVSIHEDRITIYEYYETTDGNGFSSTIDVYTQLPCDESSWYQKDNIPVEIVLSGGIEHYIMSNLGVNTVVWTVGNYECSISGNLSNDTLKAIIYSIYN